MQSVGIGIGISQFCLYSGNTEMSYCLIFFSLGMMAAFIGDTIGGFFFSFYDFFGVAGVCY